MVARIFHIILAALLMISSSGLLINKHFCQDRLKDIRLFAKAKPCHVASAKSDNHQHPPSCPFHPAKQKDDTSNNSCCEDESSFLKLEVEKDIPVQGEVKLTLTLFCATFEGPSWKSQQWRTAAYSYYKPPLLRQDRMVLFQSFLC